MKSSYSLGFNIRQQACSSLNAASYETTDEPEDNPIIVDNTIDIEMEENENNDSVTRIMDLSQEIPPRSIQPEIQPTPTVSRKRPLAQANILNPVSKRKRTGLKQTTLDYLEKKNEQQFKIRCKELELQTKKQLLEESKYELEKQERINRMEIENKRIELENRRLKIEEERSEVQLDLVRNQQELLKLVLKKRLMAVLCTD